MFWIPASAGMTDKASFYEFISITGNQKKGVIQPIKMVVKN